MNRQAVNHDPLRWEAGKRTTIKELVRLSAEFIDEYKKLPRMVPQICLKNNPSSSSRNALALCTRFGIKKGEVSDSVFRTDECTSGFRKVRSSTFRSPGNRFLHEQRSQFGKSSWYLLRTQDLTPLSARVSVCSTFTLAILVGLVGCTNLRYGQMDCSVLQGEAARMCQEYRQRKADADIRAEVAELLQGYNSCRKRYDNKPEPTKSNCSVYEKPLSSIGPLPKYESQ